MQLQIERLTQKVVADYEGRTLKKHWRVMQRQLILYLIKKLLHIMLVILKSDSADVNWLLTLLRLL